MHARFCHVQSCANEKQNGRKRIKSISYYVRNIYSDSFGLPQRNQITYSNDLTFPVSVFVVFVYSFAAGRVWRWPKRVRKCSNGMRGNSAFIGFQMQFSNCTRDKYMYLENNGLASIFRSMNTHLYSSIVCIKYVYARSSV